MKFGKMTHIGSLQSAYFQNFEFLEIQDGSGRHLENHKNCDISAVFRPIFMKFGVVMQNGSINCSSR